MNNSYHPAGTSINFAFCEEIRKFSLALGWLWYSQISAVHMAAGKSVNIRAILGYNGKYNCVVLFLSQLYTTLEFMISSQKAKFTDVPAVPAECIWTILQHFQNRVTYMTSEEMWFIVYMRCIS